jgi:hypothetical protein
MRFVVLLAAALLAGIGPSYAHLFVYVTADDLDAEGKQVIDPATGKVQVSGFCLLWKDTWTADTPDIEILDGDFYTGLSFRTDPQKHQITVYKLTAPRVISTNSGTGWYPIGGQIDFSPNITMAAYDQPQPGWPCTQKTWDALMTAPEREIVFPPLLPAGAGGGFNYPAYRERMRKNACANQQAGRTMVVICHGY